MIRSVCLCITLLAMSAAMSQNLKNTETAVLAGGCFWCIEAVFERLDGVASVEAGYAGGTKENPTYEQVCSGTTGHAEVARITYDPAKITFDSLLSVFWEAHDPTSLNRQGADAGTQYRSAIFYQTAEQKKAAEHSLKEAQKSFEVPIVTEIVPLKHFFKAEDYHQDYFKNHPNAPYCVYVIKPKLHKLNLK
jgi:peptide-methionine (S)-S-oxide reductase